MKKSILSFVFVLALATVASAAPRFGIIGEQETGLGAFVTDDMYNAQITFSSETQDGGTEYSASAINIGGNYKIALDSVTALTAGVSYRLASGNYSLGGVYSALEHDGTNVLSVNVGFERALSSNIVLTTQAAAYTATTVKIKDVSTEVKETTLFSDGRVGVAYLF